MSRKKSSAASSALAIMILIIVSRVFGFFRESTIAALFGATSTSDAYFMAINIVTIMFTIIGTGCITVVFQPYYTKLSISEGTEPADAFASNTLNVLTCVSVLLALLIIAFAKPIVHFFAPNFPPEQIAQTVPMVRMLASAFVFSIIGMLLASVLNSQRKFLGPQIIGLPPSICVMIGGLLFAQKFGIYAIVYSAMLGWLLQAVMMLAFSSSHFKYYRFFDLKDKHIKILLLLAVPTFIGVAIGDINTTVDRMLASGLPEGSISGMNFASKLMSLINGVLTVAIGTAIFPDLSEYVTLKNDAAFSSTISASLSFLSFALIPITPFVIVFRNEIVHLVFERGAFDSSATGITASVFACYSIALFFIAFRDILSRAFYAMHDTKTPMINSAISLVINIALNLIVIRYLKAPGLALATSISTIVCSILLSFNLSRKIGNVFTKNLIKNMLKIIIASGIMITSAILFSTYIRINNKWLSFIATFAVAFAVYVLICRLTKVSEIEYVLVRINKPKDIDPSI